MDIDDMTKPEHLHRRRRAHADGGLRRQVEGLSAIDLGAIASRAAMERTGVRPEMVDHVVFGNVLQTSSDAIYGARHVALKAGVPIEVPALTVNRLVRLRDPGGRQRRRR